MIVAPYSLLELVAGKAHYVAQQSPEQDFCFRFLQVEGRAAVQRMARPV